MKKISIVFMSILMALLCFTVNIKAESEDLVISSDAEYIGDQNNQECIDFIISSGATLTLINENDVAPFISVFGDITIEGTLLPCQDAVIRVQSGCNFTGIEFWDPTGQEQIIEITEETDFVYIEGELNKWVLGLPALEDKTFDTDFIINGFYEFGSVTINSDVTLSFTNEGYLCVRGDFDNNGTLNPVDGAIIAIDGGTFEGIDLYEADGETPVTTISEYMEFIYLESESKWVQYFPPNNIEIKYDEEQGEVYHYESSVLTLIQQDWNDFGDGPFYSYLYQIDGEDTYYIKAKEGFMFDHIEAEGDDPSNPDYPGNRIINEESQADDTIEGITYNVVKVTTNPNDSNFYSLEFVFKEDPEVLKQRFIDGLKTYNLALYTGSDDTTVKEYVARAIYNDFVCSLEDNNEYKEYYDLFGDDGYDSFKEKVSIVTGQTASVTPITIDGTSQTDYFEYTLDGMDGFVGVVYKLESKNEFVLGNGDSYTVIKPSEGIETSTTNIPALDDGVNERAVVKYISNIDDNDMLEYGCDYVVFGNYVSNKGRYRGLLQDYQDLNYVNTLSTHPLAVDDQGTEMSEYGVRCVLVLYRNDFVGITIHSETMAEPWNYRNLPVYPLNTEYEANIFYLSDRVFIEKAFGANDASNIQNVTFENGTTEWNGCHIETDSNGYVVSFGSVFYDRIPLNVKFVGNNNTYKITLQRAGFVIEEFNYTPGHDFCQVYGEEVTLEEGHNQLIVANFYYDRKFDDGADGISRVQMFVKITYDNGIVETKLVDHLEYDTDEIKECEAHMDGYAYFDVFPLWEGGFDDIKPAKIEVLAFNPGEDGFFGGVKLGSGSGVKWIRERGRQ